MILLNHQLFPVSYYSEGKHWKGFIKLYLEMFTGAQAVNMKTMMESSRNW